MSEPPIDRAPGGVGASPTADPESRPPDEAEQIIRAASPARLLVRILLVLAVPGLVVAGVYGFRAYKRSLLARDPPMVSIPAGSFRMGAADGSIDERPEHTVDVAAFRIDRTEVTVAAYALCVKAMKCEQPVKHGNCNWGREGRADHPINCVDWHQAKAYCEWAGKRLPTEEEWEYVARGPDGRRFPWGDDPPAAALLNICEGECRRAATRANGKEPPVMYDDSDGWGTTAPVGSYPRGASAAGVLDLAGNVWEWTSSPYCSYARPGCSTTRRVTRGGGWMNAYRANVESTTRAFDEPTGWSESMGVRCAR